MYICVTIITKEEEARNLRGGQEGAWEELKERE